MPITNIFQFRTTNVTLLSILYFVMSVYLFNKYGTQFVNDSPRYLNYACYLKSGFYYDPLNFWYFTYAIFIYLHQFFSDAILPIIINQYLIGYFAVLALYRATGIITGNKTTALLASLLFIIFPDNLFWHSYILTESIYSSFLCFSFYAIILHLKAPTKSNFTLIVITVTICFFCKPTSPALIFALVIPWLAKFLKNPSYRLWKISSLIVTGMTVLILANQMINMHRVMLIYEKGDIIFAMHQIPNNPFHDFLRVTPPDDLHVPEQDGPLIISMVEFIVNNPIYWVKLLLGKLIVYLSHIRPYWSWSHIIAVILIIWPSYYFAIMTLRKKLLSKKLLLPIFTYLLMHLLIVCNTWVDWDARFFVPLFPALALLAAVGLADKLEQLQAKPFR